MNVCAALMADPQSAQPVNPSKGSFDDPTSAARPFARVAATSTWSFDPWLERRFLLDVLSEPAQHAIHPIDAAACRDAPVLTCRAVWHSVYEP